MTKSVPAPNALEKSASATTIADMAVEFMGSISALKYCTLFRIANTGLFAGSADGSWSNSNLIESIGIGQTDDRLIVNVDELIIITKLKKLFN